MSAWDSIRKAWRPVRARLREPTSWGAIGGILMMIGIGPQEVAIITDLGPDLIQRTEGSDVWKQGAIIGSFLSFVAGLVIRERDHDDNDSDVPSRGPL